MYKSVDTDVVIKLAEQLGAAFIRDKRTSGEEFVKLKDGSPQWMTDVIREMHDNGHKLPDDTVYAMIEKCADAIAEGSDPQDAISEIEADIYTHDLTAWLNSRNDHVEYLTEVLEEWRGDIKDGSQLLQLAQLKQIQEVGSALIQALEERAEELEAEAE